MKIITETDRLLLREFEAGDAEAMYELNSDSEVIRYTGDPPFESVEAATEFLAKYDSYRRLGYGRWAVILKETGEFVGWCGLGDLEPGHVDIGFRFFRRHWGKGYATESARAAMKVGFEDLGLEEIIGRVVEQNVASVKVLEKLGMKYWKRSGCKGFEGALFYRLSKTDPKS